MEVDHIKLLLVVGLVLVIRLIGDPAQAQIYDDSQGEVMAQEWEYKFLLA